jgi:hypothetical protein
VTVVSATDALAVGWRYTSADELRPFAERWNGVNWSLVPAPFRAGQSSQFRGVAAGSATTALAVGEAGEPLSRPTHPLTQKWNGTNLSAVAAPNLGRWAILFGVAAASATEAVAVGFGVDVYGGPEVTLIERWNGSSWSTEAGADPSPISNHLLGVAQAGGQWWAVGSRVGGARDKSRTLIETSCPA